MLKRDGAKDISEVRVLERQVGAVSCSSGKIKFRSMTFGEPPSRLISRENRRQDPIVRILLRGHRFLCRDCLTPVLNTRVLGFEQMALGRNNIEITPWRRNNVVRVR